MSELAEELPPRVQELLANFAASQARPVSDPALVERMRTEATDWINAIHLQIRRLATAEPEDRSWGGWRHSIDLHFLVIALARLRRAVGLAARVGELQDTLAQRIASFDSVLPYLARLRNTAEHFDDYTLGKGRDVRTKRHQLQTWSMETSSEGKIVWRWLGETLDTAEAHLAATQLYRGFFLDTDSYFAERKQSSD